jgi:hypothetical protein
VGVNVFRDGRETPGSLYCFPRAAIPAAARETTMRTRMVLALGLLLTMASAGCARDDNGNDPTVASAVGGNPTASASASAAADAASEMTFAQCMRAHGMTWFPDSKSDGGMAVNIPKDTPKAKMDAAQEACKKYLPNGGEPAKLDAAALEQARQVAKCMRENGVPNFPDPDANGDTSIDGNKVGGGPGDPGFDAAAKACAKYQPVGPAGTSGGETHVESNG